MKTQLPFCILVALFCITQSRAQSVSRETAKNVAIHFFNSRAEKPIAEMRQVERPATFAQANTPEAYFVFEPIRGDGFVMVSGDKNATPILGYSTNSKFKFEGMPSTVKYWMGQYEHQIQEIRKTRYKATPEVAIEWEMMTSNTFASTENNRIVWQLLQTEWSQEDPYNAYCPTNAQGARAVTGCAATAMAQVMRYWEWPSGNSSWHWVEYDDDYDEDSDVQGTFSGLIGGSQYTWGYMPNKAFAGNPVNYDLAKLMSHAGLAVEMNYGTASSGASPGAVADAMADYFNYQEGDMLDRDDYDDDEWVNMIQTSINSGIPLLYSARTTDEAGDLGHMWVLDGYDNNRFHMNWGWNGVDNGFFYLGFLFPLSQLKMFSEDQAAIFGVVPNGMSCPQTYFSSDIAYTSKSTSLWISAQSSVLPYFNVTFSAGDSVTLRPDFTAYAGCEFTATIGGCTGNLQGDGGAEGRSAVLKKTKNSKNPILNIAPNPFSGSTTITYSLQNEEQVAMNLMDAMGRLVATPLPTQTQAEGEHQFNLEAGNLPAGMYFLVMQLGENRETKRLILTK